MLDFNPERRQFLEDGIKLILGSAIAIDAFQKRRSGQTSQTNMVPIEVERYYPELSPITITGRGSFRTSNNGRIRWLNTSYLRFNEENAKRLFNYYENIAQTGGISHSFDYLGQRVEYFVTPFPDTQEAVMFIVGADEPLPSWGQGDYQGVTDLRQVPPNISVIRTLPINILPVEDQAILKNNAGLTLRTFAAEAANLSFVVRDRQGTPYRLGQETFINSLSRFVAARIMGATYEDYVRSVEGYGTIIPGLGPFPFFPFPRRDYQLVRLPGAIFTE